MIFFCNINESIYYQKTMQYNNKWFSLIEVIVATSILTIAVFWVFKLIAENSKMLSNSNNFMQANFLLQPVMECLDNIWLITLQPLLSPVYIDLGLNWTECSVGTNNTILILDNIEYQIYADKTGNGIDFIDWNIVVDSNLNWKTSIDFLQK